MRQEGRKRGTAKPSRARPDRQGVREADACRMFGRAALRGSFMRQGESEGVPCLVGPCRAARGLRPSFRVRPPSPQNTPLRALPRAQRGSARSRTALGQPESCGSPAANETPAGISRRAFLFVVDARLGATALDQERQAGQRERGGRGLGDGNPALSRGRWICRNLVILPSEGLQCCVVVLCVILRE